MNTTLNMEVQWNQDFIVFNKFTIHQNASNIIIRLRYLVTNKIK